MFLHRSDIVTILPPEGLHWRRPCSPIQGLSRPERAPPVHSIEMSPFPMSLFMRSTLLVLFLCLTPAVHAATAGNPVKGEQIYQQCAACHAVGPDASNGVGPVLNHVFGRQAASVQGVDYSEAMMQLADEQSIVWHEKSLFQFLAGPQRMVPGTLMVFDGLRTEREIKDLLAYLIQFSPAYEAGSHTAVDPALAAASTLPEVRSSTEEEAVPEFTTEYLSSADAIRTGGEHWASQCRHCHGNSAYPGKAPKLTPANYTPEFVFDRITNGFRKMPAWKSVFTLEQRKALVANILSPEFAP